MGIYYLLSLTLLGIVCGYFDPHNHISGILRWDAYANLKAYTENGEVTREDKENLLAYLIEQGKKFTLQPYSTATRLAYGSVFILKYYQNTDLTKLEDEVIDGILERILETTAFTEFDSAYKLRGTALTYNQQSKDIYNGNMDEYYSDICDATIRELGWNGVTASEQSMSFVGRLGVWDEKGQKWAQCFDEKTDKEDPEHRFLLQDLTTLFGAINETHYVSFEDTGECLPKAYPAPVNFTALLEGYAKGLLDNSTSGISDRNRYWDLVIGMDFASPETTCFGGVGLQFFEDLVRTLYDTCKERREEGWEGRLVLHVHCGEGFAIYYTDPTPPADASFEDVFGSFPEYSKPPNARTNNEAPKENSRSMVERIREIKEDITDLDCYVIIRLGHVAHISPEIATLMSDLGVEADVNLDSNLITGSLVIDEDINTLLADQLADPVANYDLNNLTAVLIPDPTDVEKVGSIFNNTSLYTLIIHGVKIVMLGTDGSGAEQIPLTREVVILNTLLSYYESSPNFPAKFSADITTDSIIAETTRHHDLVTGKVGCDSGETSKLASTIAIGVGVALGILIVIVILVKKPKNIDHDHMEAPDLI
jgi:hypothetical protein